jgi:WD40 repeat protein
MKSERPRRSSCAALLLCAACACVLVWSSRRAPVARARQSASTNTPAGEAARQSKLTPRLVAELAGYEGPSSFNSRPALVAFSPDGQLLAVSGDGGAVKLFEAATGKPRVTLASAGAGFNGFSFSPDSRTAATRDVADHSVRLWDVETGKLLLKLAGRSHNLETKLKSALVLLPEFAPVPFSPDGRAVLTEREDDVTASWDAATGRQLAAFEHDTETNAAKDTLKLFTGRYYPLLMWASFSPDGARVVTANGDKSPKLWDAAGHLVAALARGDDRVYFANFLPGGRAVMTFGMKGDVNLWDAATGGYLRTLAENRGRTYGTALSRDGRLVATQVDDETFVFDASTGQQLAALKKNKARLLAFSPDGRTLATAGGGSQATAKLWDAATGQLKLALPKPDDEIHSIEFSPDGRLLLSTSDRGVRLWDAATGAPLAALDRSRFPAHFSPDSRLLATGGTNKTAFVYELSAQ